MSFTARLFTFASFVLLLSCNNGPYDANPDVTNNTNVTQCDIPITDTACACIDSLSAYSNGELWHSPDLLLVYHDTISPGVVWLIISGGGKGVNDGYDYSIDITIKDYHGVGEYVIPGTYDTTKSYVLYGGKTGDGTFLTGESCTGGKVTIIEDANGRVKGRFYFVAYSPVGMVYESVKGGYFNDKRNY